MVAEIFDLVRTLDGELADRGDDLDLRGHDLEYYVETDLVVAGAGRAVGYVGSSEFLHMLEDFEGLENTL